MTTAAQSIAGEYAEGRGGRREGSGSGGIFHSVKDFFLLLTVPFIGLGFAVAYGFIGLAAIFCYGLKYVGVSCGIMKV